MMKGISIGQLPQMFYVLMVIGAFVGATYIMLENFQDSSYEDTLVSNESINFVANNTLYSITNTPVRDSPAWVLYYNASHLSIIPSNYYTFDDTENPTKIKVYTNGTGGFPNITTGIHYFEYTYGEDTKASGGIGFVMDFVDNITENLPTVGIIIFIVILVGVILWLRGKQGVQGGS